MNTKEATTKDSRREETGYYESGIGLILHNKWVGAFNHLPISTQQQIIDYAESVAIQFESNARRKVLHVTTKDIHDTMPPDRPVS